MNNASCLKYKKVLQFLQDIQSDISGELSMGEDNDYNVISEYNKENTLDNKMSSSDEETGGRTGHCNI